MANPRIEEVSDDDDFADDPEEMDLDAFDFARPQGSSLGPQPTAAGLDAASQLSPAALQQLLAQQNSHSGGLTSASASNLSDADRERVLRDQQARTKHYQALYPVYFDATRSREQGRRVSKADAVENPLARDIADALQYIGQTMGVGLKVLLEPAKTHPKDWANPGRVKVLLKEEGRAVSPKVKNKSHLYKLIAKYLKAHPTTEDSPMRLRIQGMPMPTEKIPPPAVPRGAKIGSILPLHSPAISGGGVSENFLKDMMAEMGGQMPPGMLGAAGGDAAPGPAKKVRVVRKR